jgi:ABC-type phosphate transport system ATPase subunit
MQQDAQVSEGTAFRYPVRLDEFDAQEKISAALAQQRSQDYITGQSG